MYGNYGGGDGAYVSRRYDSLTGVWTPSVYPSQTIITAPPSDLPVSLATVKNALPVYDTADDNYITILIGAVTEQISRYIGIDPIRLTRQSLWYRPFTDNYLDYGIHGTVSSVISQAEDGTNTTLTEGTDYYIQGIDFKRIRLINMGLNGVFLLATYQSGYEAGSCPEAIQAAIIQEVSLQYKNRQDPDLPSRVSVNGLSIEARHLLLPYLRYIV